MQPRLTFQLIDGAAHWRVLRQAEAGHVARAGHKVRRMIQQLCPGQAAAATEQQQRQTH